MIIMTFLVVAEMIKMTYIVATYISISTLLAKISATKQQLNYAVMIYIYYTIYYNTLEMMYRRLLEYSLLKGSFLYKSREMNPYIVTPTKVSIRRLV